MDPESTDLVLTLYDEGEISEYAARLLLDDETVDSYNDSLEEAGRIAGHHDPSKGMVEWPDDVPMPGHLSEEEYYVEGN